MKYYVYVNDMKEYFDLSGDPFETGEEVHLRVPFMTDTSTYVTSDDCSLINHDFENGCYHYSFIMPDHDVHIDVSSRSNMTMMDCNNIPPMGFMGMGMNMLNGLMNSVPSENPVPPETVFCSECGSLNYKSSKFCRECGAKLKNEE